MLAKTQSYTLIGLNGVPVCAEVDVGNGLPSFDIVGLGDTAVKESKERIVISFPFSFCPEHTMILPLFQPDLRRFQKRPRKKDPRAAARRSRLFIESQISHRCTKGIIRSSRYSRVLHAMAARATSGMEMQQSRVWEVKGIF